MNKMGLIVVACTGIGDEDVVSVIARVNGYLYSTKRKNAFGVRVSAIEKIEVFYVLPQ
jgi:hypothetical protein